MKTKKIDLKDESHFWSTHPEWFEIMKNLTPEQKNKAYYDFQTNGNWFINKNGNWFINKNGEVLNPKDITFNKEDNTFSYKGEKNKIITIH
jgi:hypothetical protein